MDLANTQNEFYIFGFKEVSDFDVFGCLKFRERSNHQIAELDLQMNLTVNSKTKLSGI